MDCSADENRILLTGSSTIAPLVLQIAKRYEQYFPGVRIDVQAGGSARGISDVRRGMADIGMVSRALRASESDLMAHQIAIDGIGLIVHSSNNTMSLTEHQVVSIFTGRVRNWRDIGGEDLPITVVNKAEGRSTLDVFLQHFSLKNREIKPQVIIGDNQQGIKTVSGISGAIGYVSIGSGEYEEARGTSIRLLSLAGHPATVEHVSNGTYPLSRQLNLVVSRNTSILVREFLAFSRSEKVRDLVEDQYFVFP